VTGSVLKEFEAADCSYSSCVQHPELPYRSDLLWPSRVKGRTVDFRVPALEMGGERKGAAEAPKGLAYFWTQYELFIGTYILEPWEKIFVHGFILLVLWFSCVRVPLMVFNTILGK